ncbi:MAG: tetratricopeptide repeat protein [Candidatus Pacearchaeota archaeon]
MNSKKIILFLFVICLAGFVSSQQQIGPSDSFYGGQKGTASYVNYGSSFNTYYGGDLNTYWPILSNRDSCDARQDILVQISPIGCQPAVVRSDLLAEQNVPVFCQIDLLQLNPAIDVKQIRSLRFNGKYPEYVAGVGFHPARAGLRTQDRLLGSPLQSNIGYVVVILKRNPTEKELPNFFNFTLSATVDYYSGNAIGIGATELILQETNDNEWQTLKDKQTFLKGEYSVRLLRSDPNQASVALYHEDVKSSEVNLVRGQQQPNPVYLPNSYCQTGLQFSYEDFSAPSNIVRIQVDDDILDLYEGARFLNGHCTVRKVTSDEVNVTAEIVCGREKIILSKNGRVLKIGDKVYLANEKYQFDESKEYSIINVSTKNNLFVYDLALSTDSKNIIKSKSSTFVKPVDNTAILFDATYGDNDQYIVKATQAYEEIADSYGDEQKITGASPELSQFYGELALDEAIELADLNGKTKTAARLMEKALAQYPNSPSAKNYRVRLAGFYSTDSSLAGTSIQTDDGFHVIKILETSAPLKRSSAKIVWGSQDLAVTYGASTNFADLGTVTILSVPNEDSVKVNVVCSKQNTGQNVNGQEFLINIRDNTITPCGSVMRVSNIDSQKYIKLRINPTTKTTTTSNFTVGIGIEKRAFKLTPDKALEKIDTLNKTIKTWESISNNLGNVVTGLKGACFATAGVLTVKNFFTGLSGEALARRDVMQGDNGWTKICQNEVNANVEGSGSLTECYNKYSDQIKSDVNARTLAIKTTNDVTKQIETASKYPSREGVFAGDSFDDLKARKELILKIRADCGTQTYGEQKTVAGLFEGDVNNEAFVKQYSYSQLRDVYFNCQAIKNGGSTQGQDKARTDLLVLGNQIEQRKTYEKDVTQYKGVGIYSLDNRVRGTYSGETGKTLKSKGFTNLPAEITDDTAVQVVRGYDYSYLVTLKKTEGTGYQRQSPIYKLNGQSVGEIYAQSTVPSSESQDDLKGLPNTFDLTTTGSYYNSFAQGETTVRYFETEPYKGMPAIVPFELNRGFYAATTQSLPLLGQTKSFEASGKPSSFWVCNIMQDKRIGFYAPNYGDDQCVQFNVYSGQPFTSFPGLTEQETKKLTLDAIKALEEAAQQYGKKSVNILGNSINVGNPASLVPGTQCQDFMSPEDCKLLFNVCDPVICPATRCDFGGTYRVADVIQSGIVGSALLCLPNYKEGIVLPVCLTGIKAGIDGYLSILKSHQQCLQEAVDTGKYVGICDQVNSVYLCEFFWRQAAPLASAVLPKVVEYAYNGGQGNVRGGGEYLTVASSWQNAEDSAKYFTQTYAVNSIDAFNYRSVAEAGTPFCRAFVSAKGPKAFEGLIEPDSPTQFHAWFSSIDYTDATIPATAQYKVFYHIFAGNDRGASYSVYLKDPPATGAYSANPIVVVATGFAAKGQYATESKDFTAPKGYKSLCVRINDNEECGFKQVSSSFAVNYVRDSIVSDEITRTDINTESQCVSGSVSPLALLNPNLEEAAQEAIDPALYNRGVVRICATDNPGLSTDPTRFVKVGICGESRLGCWLDKRSVDTAITDSNIGERNKTLAELQSFSKTSLSSKADILSNTEFGDKLKVITDKISNPSGVSVSQGSVIIKELDELNGNLQIVLFNKHRAEILYWKARTYSAIFKSVLGTGVPKSGPPVAECTVPQDCTLKYGATEGGYSCDNGYCSSLTTTVTSVSSTFVQIKPFVVVNNLYQIYLGGNVIGYIDLDNQVFLNSRKKIGDIKDGRIIFLDNDKTVVDEINSVFGSGSITALKQKSTMTELLAGYDLK